MTNLEALNLLKQVRELLSVPERWTQNTAARDANGEPCETIDPKATCWCIMGAFWKFADQMFNTSDMCHIMQNKLANFNDSVNTTHKDVLTLLDDRIIFYASRNPEGDIYD